MPGKKKTLPKPCPICGRENGTLRIQVYPKDSWHIYCKIGHYVAEEYKKPTPMREPKGINELGELQTFTRPAKNRGKIWHCFRIYDSFEMNRIRDYYFEISKREKNPRDYNVLSKFEEIVKRHGWQMKPYSNKYHGRRRKYSKYHFENIPYENYHQDEKSYPDFEEYFSKTNSKV